MSPVIPEPPDEIAESLKAAAELLGKAASDREARSDILKEVEAHLAKIKISDFPELAESPVVQAFIKAIGTEGLAVGESRNRGTLAQVHREWSVNDMERFPKKTFEPRETIPVTFNGITYYLQDGVEITVPMPIYDIYRDHRKALEQAKIHEDYLLGYSDRPPDHNTMSESSSKVRAFSMLGPKPDARKRGVGLLPLEDGGE